MTSVRKMVTPPCIVVPVQVREAVEEVVALEDLHGGRDPVKGDEGPETVIPEGRPHKAKAKVRVPPPRIFTGGVSTRDSKQYPRNPRVSSSFYGHRRRPGTVRNCDSV